MAPLGSKPSIKRVLCCGPVLDSYLLTAVANGTTLKRVRAETGFAFSTLHKLLRGLGQDSGKTNRNVVIAERVAARVRRNQAARRKLLTEFMRLHPEASRTEFARKHSSAYSGLIDKDREWFEANGPAVRGSSKIPPWMRPDRRAGVERGRPGKKFPNLITFSKT